jgi:hypothetical protein
MDIKTPLEDFAIAVPTFALFCQAVDEDQR